MAGGVGDEVEGCGGDGVEVGEGGATDVAGEEETGWGEKVDEGGGGTSDETKISTNPTLSEPAEPSAVHTLQIFKTARVDK